MGELSGKLQELSKSLVEMHVKNVLNKNRDGLKLRNLSDEEKENIRKNFYDLEAQVNEFVNNMKQQQKSGEMVEKTMKNGRTTIRDLVKKNKS